MSAPQSELMEDVLEPLPHAHTADILGLLEFLDTQTGGACDLFQVV